MSTQTTESNQPAKNWMFDDWCQSAGVTTNALIIEVAIDLGITHPDHPWSPQRIAEWRNGREGRDTRFEYPLAFDMICVLREIARRHKRPIFDNAHLIAHSYLFLHSTLICKYAYHIELSDLYKRCGMESEDEEEVVPSLISKVHPAPPEQLIGRETKLYEALAQTRTTPITFINGIAGDGKTALAWFTAQAAVHTQQFSGFEWITDKRSQVMLDGTIRQLDTEQHSDQRFLVKIFAEMVKRFKWHDVNGAVGQTLIQRGAEKLRSGAYLLVVDNLETINRHDDLLRELADLLYPRNKGETVRSRILVTSREEIRAPSYGQIRLDGLSETESCRLIQYLQQSWNFIPLAPERETQLAKAAGGNPLFLQIALNSYMNSPTDEHWQGLIETLTEGKMRTNSPSRAWQVLEHSFSKLDAAACWLAQIAAYESWTLNAPIQAVTLQTQWQQQFSNLKQFDLALNSLIQHRVLNATINGGYTMHSLVRAYWLGYGDHSG